MALDVRGTWSGRLVDVRGFEGELTLTLRGGSKRLKAVFQVAIGGQHASVQQKGQGAGSFTKNRLELNVKAGEKDSVVIELLADVFELTRGGLGLRGTYEVAARGHSPLQGGIISASKGQPLTSTVAHPDRSTAADTGKKAATKRSTVRAKRTRSKS